jgi:hypothetical protein
VLRAELDLVRQAQKDVAQEVGACVAGADTVHGLMGELQAVSSRYIAITGRASPGLNAVMSSLDSELEQSRSDHASAMQRARAAAMALEQAQLSWERYAVRARGVLCCSC